MTKTEKVLIELFVNHISKKCKDEHFESEIYSSNLNSFREYEVSYSIIHIQIDKTNNIHPFVHSSE